VVADVPEIARELVVGRRDHGREVLDHAAHV
jgi:hypothetical protein